MRLPDRIWVPGGAALLLALLFGGALLVRADGDPSLLVHAAPPWTDADQARGSLTVQAADEGFDGQFFYRLGVAPWSPDPAVEGVTFDLPALRSARVGYGALAFVASAGDPDLVPWSLLGVNVAAMAAVGAAGGVLARQLGRHAAWGLAVALWPGFAYTLSLDTAELVATALALGGLAAVGARRWMPALALLALAALTRETALVYAGGVGLAGLLHLRGGDRRRGRAEVLVAFGALDVFVLWQLAVWARFDEWAVGSSGGSNNLGVPFAGVLTELGRSLPPSGGEELYRLVCIAGLALLLVAAGLAWRRTSAPLEVRVAWVPAALLVLVLNDYQWSGATAFLRATTEVGVLSVLILLGGPARRLRLGTGAALAVGWAASAAAQVAKLG